MRIHPLPRCASNPKNQHGSAVLIILTIIGIGAAFLLVSALNKANQQVERDKITSAALAQAKEALIGFAATYRDTHANEIFGYLPCPDTNNDGQADTPCGTQDVSTIGRLPWNSLGLPSLRDGGGECPWLAVSGSVKDAPKTAIFNWDTIGQLTVQDAGGAVLAGATPHERPLALILAPRGVIGTQTRASAGASECGGSNTATDYLENAPISAGTGATSTITLSTAASIVSSTNNDQGLWITSKDIFDRIKIRSDFKNDIDTMMVDLRDCLNLLAPASLPVASSGNKGIDNIINACPATGTKKINVQNNWKENLLYAKLPTPTKITIDGAPTPNACTAVLLFGGERTTRAITPLTAQTRVTTTEKGNAATFGDAAMYLEGVNASSFPAGTAYSGASKFSNTSPAQDLIACITGILPGTTQVTFAANLGSFVTAGVGVSTSIPTQSVDVVAASGASGGCLWYPIAISLSGKTLRAYYTFTFMSNDPTGGTDLGNGFTFSFLRGDVGSPTACGTQSDMGALDASTLWGNVSYIVETDVHQDSANGEPSGTANHTAIMANGNVTHSATNGNLTSACNGTAQGCLHSPANTFEESSTPLSHSQRTEIHTGCDSACATCNNGGAYARIKVWTDCVSCSDTASDFASTPTVNRCTALDPSMNTFYFGFTGGFSSAGGGQGVTIRSLDLRTQ